MKRLVMITYALNVFCWDNWLESLINGVQNSNLKQLSDMMNNLEV